MSFENLKRDSLEIIKSSIEEVKPDRAVIKALEKLPPIKGRLFLLAVGKAAWQMAHTAERCLKGRISDGIVISKYGHIMGEIPGLRCFEAGHPVPDENGFAASRQALDMLKELAEDDIVVFLVSGGGSALFEAPLISGEELKSITEQLLASGASINEINAVRKRLSAVKGGKFGKYCEPASVFSIVLSDVVGDRLDVIASGPAYPDSSDSAEALSIIEKRKIKLSPLSSELMKAEAVKELNNVETVITGSVRELCGAAAKKAESLGYEVHILTEELCCEAKDAGAQLASLASEYAGCGRKIALIEGGETVVKLTGKGRGGRNQELALAAAAGIAGKNIAVFSIGSDGTDGPTDAAGGYVDGESAKRFKSLGISPEQVLKDNDSYNALNMIGGLIKTGPTGTNVNDVSVALIEG